MFHKKAFGGASALLAVLAMSAAVNTQADAIIYNTGDPATATVALGVNDEGHLNVRSGNIATNARATGLASTYSDDGTFQDATSPGCLCEGWGVAGNGIGAQANESAGTFGLTVDSFSFTDSTATSTVHMTALPGLSVTHAYAPSASDNLFAATVTITNTSADTITDVRYTRAMDWDVPPTEFSEFVTIGGVETTSELLFSSDNGFAPTNPLAGGRTDRASCGTTVSFEDCGAADHGALFDFGFGDLAAGESTEFVIYYGAAPDEASAFTALGEVGAELFSFGQSRGGETTGAPATFIFAFSGVGGEVVVPVSPVPLPAALPMFGLGLVALRILARRRKSA